MRILQIHCRYTRPGGEDVAADAEAALLRSRGHGLLALRASNAEVLGKGPLGAARALLASAWNRDAYRRVRETIREFRPDVAHVHNFWFALSPSVFAAAKVEDVPTVMTLHSYRLICPGSLLMRGGLICEKCVGGSPWKGVARRCYRNSAAQTALVARMIDWNRRRGTWSRDVRAYVAVTELGRRRFVAGGLPAEKIHVKPNFLRHDPGSATDGGEGAVFVGRLSREKGVRCLLDAWKRLSDVQLTVVGDGPERQALESSARAMSNVEFTGTLDNEAAVDQMRGAAFVVLPSLCYEGLPVTLLEAFACGRPVVASRLGAMAELIDDGRTGLLFEPGDAGDLAGKARYLLDNPSECERMGREARAEFERKYTAEANYPQLMGIYEKAIENHRSRRR